MTFIRRNSHCVLLFVCFLLILSCSKKSDDDDGGSNEPAGPMPILETIQPHSITKNSAISGGVTGSDHGFLITAKGVCWTSDGIEPDINDSKTEDGHGAGTFQSELVGLTPNTSYLARAYATNENGTGYGSTYSCMTKDEKFVTDADGNNYDTVVIGSQIWFAENLKTTTYSDGTPIPLISDNNTWGNTTSNAYCWFNNDMQNFKNQGAIYNWYVAKSVFSGGKNPCPDGWHVPNRFDWEDLDHFLSGNGFVEIEASALKSAAGWANNGNGTNDFGFSAFPTGFRSSNGTFISSDNSANWWTSAFSSGLSIGYYQYLV